ncbi:hypothetical protein [Pedobacter sp. SYP-B3415]|uniref:hypothetical protein n=1 Tax=Pedobacter sp. SYP-B3415 TaxID=2496641 RepID=UPI00101C5A85|nr:hypothetical protein [Pedobacter sp. SYP-B3415]
MQNESQQNPEEEIPNLEQFQVGRAPADEKHTDSASEGDEFDSPDGQNAEENEYTPGEIQYADGEGTRLDEEIADDGDGLTDEDVAGGGDETFDEAEEIDDEDLSDDTYLEDEDDDLEEK